MTATIQRKYPTLVSANGLSSELSIEELTLVAIEHYVSTGNFDKIKEVSLTVPIKAEIISTKEVFLEQYKGCFILVEHNVNTGDYLFGPINDKTVTLAMSEVMTGVPVYRVVTFGELNILNEEMLTVIDEAVNCLPTSTGYFTLRHHVKKGSKARKQPQVEIEEHTIASLLYKLQQASHKSLAYYDVFTQRGAKPSTLDTFVKKLKEGSEDIHYTVDIVYAKNIKELDDSTFAMTATGDKAQLLTLIDSMNEILTSTKKKEDKIYVTNIREKDTTLGEFISKKELHKVKQMFTKLPDRTIEALIRL